MLNTERAASGILRQADAKVTAPPPRQPHRNKSL